MTKTAMGKALLATASVVVIASVVAGILMMGSPAEARARRLDDQRESDLHAIVDAIDVYWSRHDRVPESIETLAAEPGVRVRTSDPATSLGYEYQVLEETRYEICATFETEWPGRTWGNRDELLAHGPGRQCFRLEPEVIDRR